MRTYAQITLQDQIDQIKKRIEVLSRWEIEHSVAIQQLIIQQADLYEAQCRLEKQLAKEEVHG